MNRDGLGVLLERYADGSIEPQDARVLADALLAGGEDSRWLLEQLAAIGRIAQVLDPMSGEECARGLAERMKAEVRGPDFLSDHLLRRRRYRPVRSAGPFVWIAAAAVATVLVALIALVATSRPGPSRPQESPSRELQASRPDVVPGPKAPVPAPDVTPSPRPIPEPPPRTVLPAPPKGVEVPPVPPTPTPAPVPAPVPIPAPPPAEPAPRPTAPTRVFLAIAKLEGAFEIRRDKAWEKLEKPGGWEEGASLRVGDRLGRFTLADGTRVTLRGRTELKVAAVSPAALGLEQGEAFFDVPPAGRRFSVVTPEARVEVTGTQFSVRRAEHTDVVVVSGEVKVSGEKGEVAVPAGNGTTIRKSAAPSKPRAVDTDGPLAWRRAADPPETARFRHDFEDGRRPAPWTNGRVAPGPSRGLNRFCLEGAPGVDAQLTRLEGDKATVRGVLVVRFRYFAATGTEFLLQLKNERVGDNFRYEVKTVVHGKWEAVEAPLSDFFRLVDRSSRLQEGDRFTWLNITVAGADGPVWFDDIELVEIRK